MILVLALMQDFVLVTIRSVCFPYADLKAAK
jgi:hypothetical protein